MSLSQTNSRFGARLKQDPQLEHITLTKNFSSVIGVDAGRLNANGVFNTVFGYKAASLSEQGDDNVVIGTLAANRSQGSRNTYVGTLAAESNVKGFDNVAVGYKAGASVEKGGENTFLGLRSGLSASGTGNVYVGHSSGALPAIESDYNVAVGHSSKAHGGSAVAIGNKASASASDAVSLGCGTVVSGAHAMALGPSLVTAGDGSLVIMPRRDGLPASFTEPETLNVYGVLTGFRDDLGIYNVRLGADREAVSIDDGSSRLAVGPHGITMSSHCNVSVTSPVVAANGLRVAFGDTVLHGRAVHHDEATFNGHAYFNAGATFRERFEFDDLRATRAAARDASIGSLEVDRGRVGGSLEVAGLLDISGTATFREGLELDSNLTVLGRTVLSNATVHEVEAEQVETDRLFVHGPLTAASGVFEDLTVYGETFINASGLSLAGELVLDSLVVKGILSCPGLASFNVVQVSDRAQATFIDSSNIDNAGDARFGGDVVVAGGISVNQLDCEYIECETILVKGQNTLTVLGGSKLNVATAADVTTEYLTVTDTCTFSNYVVIGGDLYVNEEANVGSLVVRDGLTVTGPAVTIQGRLEASGELIVSGDAVFSGGLVVDAGSDGFEVRIPADFPAGISAESIDAATAKLTAVDASAVSAARVDALETVAASGAFDVLRARDAAFSNLGAEGPAVFGDRVSIAVPPGGADSLNVGGNALIVGDLTVQGKITGYTEVNDRFSEDVFFLKSATVGEDLTVVKNSSLIGDLEVFGNTALTSDLDHYGPRAYFAGPLTRVDGVLELGSCLVLSNVADPDSLSHWRVCLEQSSAHADDVRMKDFTVRSWIGTTFQVTEDFDPDLLNFTGKHRCSVADGGLLRAGGPPSPEPLEKAHDIDSAGNLESASGLPPGVLPGMLVSASGSYKDLDGGPSITIDEAVPRVELTAAPMDPRVFGVVCNMEDPGPRRVYRLASVAFGTDKKSPGDRKLIVNSVGEGGMWVCDEGGPIANGALLCSSSSPGLAMKQPDDSVRAHTAAKITCPCDFVRPPPGGRLLEYRKPDGTAGSMAFVGVCYKF